MIDWRKTIPACLYNDVADAGDLKEAIGLAETQLDLIREGQDGTADYTQRDIRRIKKWIAEYGHNPE